MLRLHLPLIGYGDHKCRVKSVVRFYIIIPQVSHVGTVAFA
jgi:hypothetical protein